MFQLRIAPMQPIIFPIRVFGGGKSREFDTLLDTGASYLVIPTGDAIDLGHDLTVSPRYQVVTANGVVQVPLVVLEAVEVGPYVVRDVQALCLDMVGDRLSSLLGLSVLSHFCIVVDFKSGQLTVEDC